MGRRLSSYRFRRRLAWAGGLTTVAAAIVGASIWIGNTGKSTETPLSDKPVWVYHEPRLHHLTQRERLELLSTSSHFIRTAVARQRLDEAWTLLGPEMQAGQTRKSWNTGTNNVVPFPVSGIAAWNLLYSYDDDVAFDLALVAKPGHDLVGKTFTIELKRYPQRGNRWLVAAWVPKGVTTAGQSKSAAAVPPPPPPRAPLSAKWLAVPLSILALIVLTPLAVIARSLIQNRRAAKRYARDLSSYRSTSSPS
ncbi:MAG TPA: hypothetical protein VGJ77_20520 [Gaiellaceae bacterium]|jgi:hypothetical protein